MNSNPTIRPEPENTAVTFDPDPGRYTVALPGFTLKGCEACVHRADGGTETIAWTLRRGKQETGLRLAGKTASGRWTLDITGVRNADGVPGVQILLAGRLARGAAVTALAPLCIRRLAAEHLLVLGRSAGRCRALPLAGAAAQDFTSYMQTLLTRAAGTLQFCQPMLQDHPSHATGRIERGAVRDLSVVTPLPLGTAGVVAAEPLRLFAGPDGHALMQAWAEVSRRETPPPAAPPTAAWNSWDYYRWTVTEDEILKNADFIAADPVLSRYVKRVVIDDGWQYCYGEWDANPMFPHGMEWLAGRLAGMGFEPGIWMAPAVIEPHARIAQWHTDLLARGRSGQPCLAFECMRRYGFVLDPTVPRTRQWLYDLFDRYAGYGYRYFKLDFLIQTLKAPVFADPDVPPGRIVSMLLEPVRRALRGRAQMMGCGYDFFAGTAAVDAVRTSSDIHAHWNSIKENVHSIAARWWAQGRLWENDPDFALARGPETADDPDLTRLRPCLVFINPTQATADEHTFTLASMSRVEARTLLSLVLISGGAVTFSDDLTRLNARGLDLVRRTAAAERGGAGLPLDLFSATHPGFWLQRLGSGGMRLLLVNWEDEPQTLSFDLRDRDIPDGRPHDFWTDEPVAVRHGHLTADLPPHACRLVDFSRK